jgi:uncharacterized protein (DUF2147 family)
MRSLPVWAATFLLAGFLSTGLAIAAELQPTGDWRTADGRANIRVEDCNGVLWGTIAWEKEPGVDEYNPDPAQRTHPTLGVRILRSMKPTKPNLWQGEVYNPENGKIYDAKISVSAPDVLRIEGCLWAFLCGGENWTRVKAADIAPPQKPAPQQRTAAKPKDAPAPTPVLSACAAAPAGTK